MRKVLSLALILGMLAAPAYADFAALERSLSSGSIIYDVSPSYYLGQDGTALTEASIASIPTAGYSKKGLTADGNTRLILRYQAPSAGSVTFSLSANMYGTQLESLNGRQPITSAVRTTQAGNVHQASAVLVAPETWPARMTYPKDTFTVTAAFTPDSGEPEQATLTLTLQAPSVVLIHGTFSNTARAFGYEDPDNPSGIWPQMAKAGLNIISWNYNNLKGPKTVISDSNNTLAKTLIDAFDTLNKSHDIASTRADIVAHSTGGLMARQFLRNDFDTGNKSALSYKQGMIRRVVTLASPNLGTPLASYFLGRFDELGEMWQNWQAKTFWENLSPLLNILIAQKGSPQDALEDIALSSELIPQLGYPEIPFHSIYGKVISDNDKIVSLSKSIINYDTVAISNLTWLPKQFVNVMLGQWGPIISNALKAVSNDVKLDEFFTVMFNGEDHDLVVSEKSAVDVFPEYARTAYEGLEKYNHVMLSVQNDVADHVIDLLKGDTSKFMISSGVSAAQYDRAFDAYVSGLEKTFRASDEEFDMSDVFEGVSLNADAAKTEYLGADGRNLGEGDNPQIKSVRISGSSVNVFSEDVLVMIDYGDGTAKCFWSKGSNSNSFDKELWFGPADTGIVTVSYATVQNGKLKISQSETLVVAPLLYDVSGITFTSSKIYLMEGDEVKLELLAQTPEGNYDIAAPVFGITEYTAGDSSIVKVTDEGNIVGLKEGVTVLTAEAEGFTASVTVEVLSVSAASAPDSGNTSTPATGTTSNTLGSPSGGCNMGFTAMVILAGLAFAAKKR